MKLREKFKRFWTMDVHNHEGFTLVELIIVIAILAILSGVAVAGYSSYIKKANMQADKTMIAEIKNALTLAMYSDPFTNPAVGVLVLSGDGVKMIVGEDKVDIPAGSELDKVLSAAFGSNYKTTLKLKYTEWEMASYLNGMNTIAADMFANSSFLSGNRADQLLSDVEAFTQMAANLAGAMQVNLEGMTLGGLFGEELLNATAEKYGIEGPTDGNWDQWGKEHPQEFSNLLVLATAMDNANMLADNEYKTATSTTLVLSFSTYYAFASTCPEFSTVLTKYMDAMNAGTQTDDQGKQYTPIESPKGGTTNVYKVESPVDGKNWLNALETEAAKYTNANGETFEQYTAKGGSAANDQAVFSAIMATVNNVSGDDLKGQLGNANLFTEGAIKDVYDDVLNAVYALAGGADISISLEKGEVAIIFNQYAYKVTDTIG